MKNHGKTRNTVIVTTKPPGLRRIRNVARRWSYRLRPVREKRGLICRKSQISGSIQQTSPVDIAARKKADKKHRPKLSLTYGGHDFPSDPSRSWDPVTRNNDVRAEI